MLPSWYVPLSRGAVVLITGLTEVLVVGIGIGLKVETSQNTTKGKMMKEKHAAFLHVYVFKA